VSHPGSEAVRGLTNPFGFLVRAGRLAYLAYEEGRLPLSPRRWWADLRHLRGVIAAERTQTLSSDSTRDLIAGLKVRGGRASGGATDGVRPFLASGARLDFSRAAVPTASIVVVLSGDGQRAYDCLRCLLASPASFEVILTGHMSSEEGHEVLRRIDGAVITANPTGEGFAAAANRGARAATTSTLLFLIDRIEVRAEAISAITRALTESDDVGAVGARLVADDGRLAEAGRILWRDGTCHAYGQGGSPLAPQYSFTREVDCCSASLLGTRRDRFFEAGGFDSRFSDAVSVGADYCVRLWASGGRVLYTPAATAIAHASDEPAPVGTASEASSTLLVQKHGAWLSRQMTGDAAHVLVARARRPAGQRVVVFDDRVPHAAAGLGYPRALELVRALTRLGHFVTLYPLSFVAENWPSVYADIPPSVEVMTDYGPSRLQEFWSARRGYYDTAIVSRHHNLLRLRARLGEPGTWGVRVVYDAEAVETTRQTAQRLTAGQASDSNLLTEGELRATRGVHAIMSVSDEEAEMFRAATTAPVVIVRHAVVAGPTARSFSDRDGALFVGAFDPLSPNADAVQWFVREILPRIEQLVGSAVPFTIVGQNVPATVRALSTRTITVVSNVEDLRPFYDAARLFVAPTRFAAGIPLKVVHAAAHGVPVVCTPRLARQLGWTPGIEVLTGEGAPEFAAACASIYSDPSRWSRVRKEALLRVADEFSPARFAAAVAAAVEGASHPLDA
jgi:hypothetical protein